MKRVPPSRYCLFLTLAILGAFWDLYSKRVVFDSLGYPGGMSEWRREFFDGWMTFQLSTNFNEGALWGMGQGLSWLFAGLSLLAIVGVVYWLFVHGAAESWWLCVSLGFITAGTLGNLYDRLGWHGCEVDGKLKYAVRDFLYFRFGNYDYPVFNFADVFLVTGAVMLVLHSFRIEPEPSAEKPTVPKQQAAS